ncbi:uncharacterized protein LOC143253286 [Tachypleus tridentatus]|uniref:uncharacterized protein LOC143253286 n=1 Tax=Tachypleus tridentatus TaxID=6853 RepID=UPI003FD04EE0
MTDSPKNNNSTVTDSISRSHERKSVENEDYLPSLYRCPLSTDPEYYTECCDNIEKICCPLTRQFYEIENWLAIIIAVSVSLICLTLAAVVVICCFSSHCPLYNICRRQYTAEIPVYDKEEDNFSSAAMPKESTGKSRPGFLGVVHCQENNLSCEPAVV